MPVGLFNAGARPVPTSTCVRPRTHTSRVVCQSAPSGGKGAAAGKGDVRTAAPAPSPSGSSVTAASLRPPRTSPYQTLTRLGGRILTSWRSPAQATIESTSGNGPADKLASASISMDTAGSAGVAPGPLSSADATEPRQQTAAQQRESELRQDSYARSLYTWLRWSSSSSSSGSSSADCANPSAALDVGDGMATAEATPAATAMPSPRKSSSWYPSLGSLSSTDEAPALEVVAPDHPTLALLRQRVLSRSRPGSRADPFKLGLVVEGGGMRGCVSGGALQVRQHMGVWPCSCGSNCGVCWDQRHCQHPVFLLIAGTERSGPRPCL